MPAWFPARHSPGDWYGVFDGSVADRVDLEPPWIHAHRGAPSALKPPKATDESPDE